MLLCYDIETLGPPPCRLLPNHALQPFRSLRPGRESLVHESAELRPSDQW